MADAPAPACDLATLIERVDKLCALVATQGEWLRDDQDELLGRVAIARRLGIDPHYVRDYVSRWPDLMGAAVVVRVRPGSRGRLKVPKKVVLAHFKRLRQGEPIQAGAA